MKLFDPSQLAAGRKLARFGLVDFMVGPVRGDTALGVIVHFGGANLNFQNFTLRAENGGVQALVTVGFGQRNIIFDLTGQRLKVFVDDAQNGITIGGVLGNDAYSHQIGNVVNVVGLVFKHLLVKTVKMFGAAMDIHDFHV